MEGCILKYMFFNTIYIPFRKDAQPSFIVKALLGMTAGCVGAFVGTPAEVALIRMTADGRLPIGKFIFSWIYAIVVVLCHCIM